MENTVEQEETSTKWRADGGRAEPVPLCRRDRSLSPQDPTIFIWLRLETDGPEQKTSASAVLWDSLASNPERVPSEKNKKRIRIVCGPFSSEPRQEPLVSEYIHEADHGKPAKEISI